MDLITVAGTIGDVNKGGWLGYDKILLAQMGTGLHLALGSTLVASGPDLECILCFLEHHTVGVSTAPGGTQPVPRLCH